MTSLRELKQLLAIAQDFKRPLLRATLFGSLGHLTLVVFTYFILLFFLTKITMMIFPSFIYRNFRFSCVKRIIQLY